MSFIGSARRLSVVPIVALVWVVRHVPDGAADLLALLIAGAAWRIPSAARRNIIRNMAAALGLPERDSRVVATARRAWGNQALNYAENMRITSLSREEVLARIEVIGLDHLRSALAGGRGVIVATAHFGNVDFGAHAISLHGIRAVAIVQDIRSETLFRLLNDVRARFGFDLVRARPGVIGELTSLLKAGRVIGFTCDWDSVGNGIPVDFLGRRLRMPIGPVLLALRTRAPIVPELNERIARRRHRVVFHPAVQFHRTGVFRKDLFGLAQAIARVLEQRIREAPDQWCCFQDVWADLTLQSGDLSSAPGPGANETHT